MSTSKHSFRASVVSFAPFIVAGTLAIAAWVVVANRPEPGSTSKPEPEASWEVQLAAVKNGESDRIEITQVSISNEALGQLAGVDGLRELLIDKGAMSSASFVVLAQLPKLEHVRIRGAQVDDNAFRHLCQIPQLKRLNLPQAEITDDGLRAIAGLQQLELLRLGSPRVTDAGIKHLGELRAIRWLHFIDLPLGDGTLETISEHFPQLESLYIDGGKFSDEAWDNLFKKRPGLHVHIDQKHHDRDPHNHSHSH